MSDKYNFKKLANSKPSKDCTHDEACEVMRNSRPPEETFDERMKRIQAFRCGW